MAAAGQVVGGVDPHTDTIHVAVVSVLGKVVGDAEFATTTAVPDLAGDRITPGFPPSRPTRSNPAEPFTKDRSNNDHGLICPFDRLSHLRIPPFDWLTGLPSWYQRSPMER